MLKQLVHSIRQWHQNLKAWAANKYVTREVTKVLKVMHAQELMSTPRNEWPLVMRKQREEIRAVAKSGVVDIIDRRSWPYPSLPEALHRLNQPLLKNTPYSLRRFSETPIPRRAINLIKNAVLRFKWHIVTQDDKTENTPDQEQRIQISTECLRRPNNTGSFRDFLEPVIEDFLIGGYGCIEPRLTPYYQRPFKAWPVDGCYSADTEVLTKRGWIAWPLVKATDKLATRSKEGLLQWQLPEKLQCYDYDGHLLHFNNAQTVDLLVTPNHRMFGRRIYKTWRKAGDKTYSSGKERFLLAEDIASRLPLWLDKTAQFQIPLGDTKWEGELPHDSRVDRFGRVSIPIQLKQWSVPRGKKGYKGFQSATYHRVTYWVDLADWVAFLGIYTADGSASGCMGWHKFRQRNKNIVKNARYVKELAASADDSQPLLYRGTDGYMLGSYAVNIAQKRTSKHYEDIRQLLNRLPFSFNEILNGDGGFICRHKGLHEVMIQFGNKYGKHVPKWLKNLPPKYLQIFIDWAVKGDGHKRLGSKNQDWYATVSKQLADDLQELFLKIGYSAAVSCTPAGRKKMFGKIYQAAACYHVQQRKTNWQGIGDPERVLYHGKVYCATVPNGTLYVRRNGFPAWCGNSTVRIFMDWTESTPDRPHYAQMTGLKGERGIVTFLDDELIYVRDNIRSSTPFGLGKLEVAFVTVNSFLGVQDMAGRAGADQVHKTWLWWENPLNPGHIQTIRRHVQNELEGQAKLSLMSGAKKPDVIEVQPVTPQDLLLDWQEFLIRIIANAFDISPLSLGIERDVNRSTGEVLTYADFQNAVVPTAVKIQEALTHGLFHKLLGWTDLKFEFIGLDDPDSMTKTAMLGQQYRMDGVTSDEIREEYGKAPLPGGWGKLTMMQKMMVMQTAIAKATGKAGGGASGMGVNLGGGGSGMPSAGGLGSAGGSGLGMKFSAFDVAQMSPDEVSLYQELGLLPPGQELPQQMEQEAPGILEVVSDELKQYFDNLKLQENETQVQPQPITNADEKEQQKKFAEFEHETSTLEDIVNRRGVLGPAVDQSIRKAPVRGKYPKTGKGRLYLPGGHYDPGKGNKRV